MYKKSSTRFFSLRSVETHTLNLSYMNIWKIQHFCVFLFTNWLIATCKCHRMCYDRNVFILSDKCRGHLKIDYVSGYKCRIIDAKRSTLEIYHKSDDDEKFYRCTLKRTAIQLYYSLGGGEDGWDRKKI